MEKVIIGVLFILVGMIPSSIEILAELKVINGLFFWACVIVGATLAVSGLADECERLGILDRRDKKENNMRELSQFIRKR